MSEHLQRFFKHSLIYGSSLFLNRAVLFVLLPLYVRFLTVDEYGILEVLNITSTMLLLLMQMGIGSAVFRSVLYQPNRDKNQVVATAFYFLVLSAAFQTSLFLFFSPQIGNFLFDGLEKAAYIRMIVLVTLFNAMTAVPMAVLRISQRSVQYSIYSIGGFLLEIGLNVIFLRFLKLGLNGILTAMLIKTVFLSMLYIGIIRDSLSSRFSMSELREMLSFGAPQVPAAIFFTIMSLSDRYFLNYYTDLKQIGIYSFGVRIGMVVALVVNAFQTAWPATLFSIAKDHNAERQYSSIFTGYFAIIVLLVLAINLFSNEIVSIIGTSEYRSSIEVIPFITVSYLFMGIYYMTSVGLQIKKKTAYEPIIMFVPMAVNLLLNSRLVPIYGIRGAAISHTVSFSLLGVLTWLVSSRFYRIRYSHFKLSLIVGVAVIFAWLGSRIELNGFFPTLSIKAILLLLYVGAIVLMKINPAAIFRRRGA